MTDKTSQPAIPERRVFNRRQESGLTLMRLENSQRIARLGDWEYDFAHRRLLWSEGVYRILGLARSDAPPGSEVFYGLVHPDDLAFVKREEQAATEGLHRANFEHRIIRPDGEVRHVHHITETERDGEGRLVRESGTIQDVTEQKSAEAALRASEERFKFVARAVSDVVWDWNLTANTLWWNDGFLTTFGFAAGEIEPSVESWTGRMHPGDRPRVVESLQRAINNCTANWNAEYRLQRKDGSHAQVQDRGYILHNAAGRAVRMVGGMRDLTEEKNREEQYFRAQRMESIGTLAAGIAHDLNNVFAPIMLSIELLQLDPGEDPRRRKILDIINTNTHRGADLVRQVLTFARGMEGQRVAIRLRHLINDLAGMITETFPRNIRIVAEVAPDLWPIMGDPTQLHQVLMNLAVNARDAMPEGGTLTLAATNVIAAGPVAGRLQPISAGPQVRLQVTDTGVGIPFELRERIFDPFFTTKTPGNGTGIGLATVHTIVKNHRGSLHVESEPGQGSTFQIHLPADQTLPTAASEPPMVAALPRGHNELVLVVDDEVAILEVTRHALLAFGYRALIASDGAAALVLFAAQAPQVALVITDMMMPGLDGAAVILALRQLDPAIKIIATSGLSSGEHTARAASIGANYFLPKPYAAATLVKLVHAALAQPAPVIHLATPST